MSLPYVIVANSSTARFFRVQAAELPELESGPNLIEELKKENPEGGVSGREVFSDPKSGRNRISSGGSGAGHQYDEHRDDHLREMEKQFAETLAGESARRAMAAYTGKLIVVATPHMLGLLRPQIAKKSSNGIQVIEVSADVVKESPIALHHYLADKNLLPERRPPTPHE